MHFALCYGLVLLWFAYLMCSGVLLFSRGFLLSRVSKTDFSSCRRLSINPDDEYFITEEIVTEIFKDVNASSNICLPPKSKVIVLLIDALKYDFGVYEANLTDALPYQNKLPVLQQLLQEQPQSARLLRFQADPPTTTLQRLKGMTTGSLPTFIDIGSNFASPEINEDNIIDQMVRHKVPVVFMGDSTWTDLYPKRFKRAYSYPSFDIFDLDTVDNEIRRHLPKELMKSDWQVLIAHFLGVDHCGHKHGPLHVEMSRKLSEMNDVITSVIAHMDSNTTLLVMGDHGMTLSGDHGGDTSDETNALLFAYSKQHAFISSDYGSDAEVMQQIDLVPTLATILGIPIPYSNLGLINFNIVPDVQVPYMPRFQTLLLHAWQNARQMFNYFYNYAQENQRTFAVNDMDAMQTEFVVLTHRVQTIYNELAFKSFFGDLRTHLRQVLSTCRDIWVKFEPTQMSQGLLMGILPIFFGFLLVQNSSAASFQSIFNSNVLTNIYFINMGAAVFGYRYFEYMDFKSAEHGVFICTHASSFAILSVLTIKHWVSIVDIWSSMPRFTGLSTRVIYGLAAAVFFSNSFIIQEGKILSYLLTCIFITLIYQLLQHSLRADYKIKFRFSQFMRSLGFRLLLASAVAIVLLRCSFAFFLCREEQGDCGDFASSTASAFVGKKTRNAKFYVFAVIAVVSYTTVARLYLRSCGNLTGSSINVQLSRYGPIIASICVGGHILLSKSNFKNVQRSHVDAIAWIIYALLLLQILVVSLRPLMTHVLKPHRDTVVVNGERSIIPEIFRKMKRVYDGDEQERRFEIPVVYGLATIYSSVVIAFGVFLSLVLLVLLQPKAILGLLICVCVAAALLTVHGILRFRLAQSFESCIQPTFAAIIGWFLLAHFGFFATSHQTTLSQIDWRAAFVGRTSHLGGSNFVSAILVILNTFCSQILFCCLYGLLSTETFSIFALFPNLIRTNCYRETKKGLPTEPRKALSIRSHSELSHECVGFDMTRGELILFENEQIFLGTQFKLAMQLFMLQGLRVFCAMLACTFHSRHLMVWKIFAPRFIYEGIATFVMLPAIIIGYLLIVRVHYAVDGLIQRVNKVN